MKQLGIFRFRDRVSALGALGLSLCWGCSSEDSTMVSQEELELDPAPATVPARPSTTLPAGQGTGTGTSESGPSNVPLTPATDPVPPTPSEPIEYWPDGATA